jgi:hypothetical protein
MRSVLAHQQRARSGGRNVGGMLLVNKTNRSAGRRTDCGWLLQRRARMRKSLAAALMPFIFAYVAPAFAADPTDARLMADVAVAKATITLLQSRDFTAVRDRFQPALGPLPDDVLAGMADVIAGEAKSVETISPKGTFNPATGNGESQTILEYQIGLRWVVADVVVKTENNIKRVSGLYFSTNSQPLRELSVFHLSGKGFAQYAFLAGWIGIIGLTGWAMVLAFRRHSGWWRWALMIAMPLGLGPAVAMNWNNAAFWILGGPSQTVPFLFIRSLAEDSPWHGSKCSEVPRWAHQFSTCPHRSSPSGI